MSTKFRTKAILTMAAFGFAGALFANPAAALAESDRGSGCLEYHATVSKQKTKLATICRQWWRNDNGKFDGHYKVMSALPNVDVFAYEDGVRKAVPKGSREVPYYNKASVRLQACYKGACSEIK